MSDSEEKRSSGAHKSVDYLGNCCFIFLIDSNN